MNLDKMIAKLGKLNKLAYENLILSINNSFTVGKVASSFQWLLKAKELIFGHIDTKLMQLETHPSIPVCFLIMPMLL